jgi:HK97 family phage major capsid protein
MAASGGLVPTDPSLPDAARLGPFYGVVPQLRRRLRLLDLIPTQAMEGAAFHYAVESGDLDSAFETAEGSIKPQGDQVLDDGIVEAKTIAHWNKVRRQQLADVPTLSTVVSTRLSYGVSRRVENQIVAGDGTGENLRGILHTTGISVVDYTAEPLADLALAGIADILGANAEPNAVILNPADWTSMLAAKAVGSGERLDSDGAFSTTADTLWGLPALISTVIPAGTALVGDWSLGATLFVREGVNLRISDSDQDDFVRNVVTLLAEGRFGMACWRPACFSVVAFAADGASGYGMRFRPPQPAVAGGPPGATGPS